MIVKDNIGFERGKDVIKGSGLGVFSYHEFKNSYECAKYIVNNLTIILDVDNIPGDFLEESEDSFNDFEISDQYYPTIYNYILKYTNFTEDNQDLNYDIMFVVQDISQEFYEKGFYNVNENMKFKRGEEVIKGSNLGVFSYHEFKTPREASNYILNNLEIILDVDSKPTDFIELFDDTEGEFTINDKYFRKIQSFIEKYTNFSSTTSNTYDYIDILNFICLDYSPDKKLYEFERGKDVISSSGLGLYRIHEFEYVEDAIEFVAKHFKYILNIDTNYPSDLFIKKPYQVFNDKYFPTLWIFCKKYIKVKGIDKLQDDNFYKGLANYIKNTMKINENISFKRESDPIKSSSLGVFSKKKFNIPKDAAYYILDNYKIILNIENINELLPDLGDRNSLTINRDVIDKLLNYINEYIIVDNYSKGNSVERQILINIRKILDPNYKLLNENISFKRGEDVIKSSGLGIKNKIENDLKKAGYEIPNLEVLEDNTIVTSNIPNWQKRDILEVQVNYYNDAQNHLLYIISNVKKEYTIPAIEKAIEEGLSLQSIKNIIDNWATDNHKQKAHIYLNKLNRNKEEKTFDDENNLYVFIGFTDKKPIKINGKTYYEDKFSVEKMIKIDKYNTADLQMIPMMKMRAKMQYPDGKVYMIHIPKEWMGEESYNEIPEDYYDVITQHMKKI